MKMINGTCTDVKIAYIGGGSHGWAWTFMRDLALETELSGEISLYDIDNEMAEQNAVIGNRLFEREEVPGNWKFTVRFSLKELLSEQPDFVVISILPGTFDEMDSDVHPVSYTHLDVYKRQGIRC